MIGDTSVGKSCLLTRFADDQFSDNYVTTIGVDFRFKTMIIKDKIAKVQVWDTAGQERYRSITNAYYRGAEAIMIVFDMTNKESFQNIQNWMDEIIKYTGKDVLICIGGNKTDLPDQKVTSNDIDNFKKKKGLSVFEVSAKTGAGVEEAFTYLVTNLIKRKSGETETEEGNATLEKPKENNKKPGCC